MGVSGPSVLKGSLVLAGVLAGLAAVLLLLLWLAQRKLIYLPDNSPVPAAAEVLPHAEDVTLTTDDGLELGAWYVPAAGARRDQGNATVLVANGNGGNRAGRAPLARALAGAGLNVLLFDYRGYGGNPGSPSESGLARDARAAYRHLVDERGVPPERLVYFGESLGTGVITELGTEYPPAGLFLRSPFTDLAAVGQRHYPLVPVGWLLRDRYPVAEQLSAIDVPTTVVYGTEDSIIPPATSQDVADAAAGPVEVVAIRGAGHNDDVMFDGRELVAAVVDLADRALRD